MHEFSPFRYYKSYTIPILKIIGLSLTWIAWTVFCALDYIGVDPDLTHEPWFGVIGAIGIVVAYVLIPIQICSSITEILFAHDNIKRLKSEEDGFEADAIDQLPDIEITRNTHQQ